MPSQQPSDQQRAAHLLAVFLMEARAQAGYAVVAADDFKKCLADRDVRRFWFNVQAFLVAAANVSKLLKNPTYGPPLELELGVALTSPVHERDLRNAFEHFDERLATWASQSKTLNLIDSSIMPPNVIQGIDADAYLRNFDPATETFTFRGVSLVLPPLVVELRRIHAQAEASLERLHQGLGPQGTP
jgi:hypothetical protein